MSRRRWGVHTRDKLDFQRHDFITLTKLKRTIRSLKAKGGIYANNVWFPPIVPLLIEHIFLETEADLKDIDSVTLHLNEGRDLKLC